MAQVAEKPVFKDDTYYPPAQSAAGTNAYYLDYCTTGGCRPGYAVCLHKIQAHAEGRLPAMFSACQGAMEWKTCPAMAMRQQEELEGRAMFYVDRQKQQEFFEARAKAPVTSEFLKELKAASKEARESREEKKPAPAAVTKTAPQPAPAAPIIGSVFSYAAAINEALNEETKPEPVRMQTQLPVVPTAQPVTAIAATTPPSAARATIAPPKMLPGESMLEFAKRVRALKEKEAAQTTH
jgi:hypothetical protein